MSLQSGQMMFRTDKNKSALTFAEEKISTNQVEVTRASGEL